MGTRVEQSGEFLPCAGRARRCHLEDMADSLHRLPSAAEELQVIISRSNRALLLQGEFRITLLVSGSYLEWPLVPGFDRNKSAHKTYLRHPAGFCPSGFRRTDLRKADRGWRPTPGWGRP